MNLSLVMIVLLLGVVFPVLLWLLFSSQKQNSQELYSLSKSTGSNELREVNFSEKSNKSHLSYQHAVHAELLASIPAEARLENDSKHLKLCAPQEKFFTGYELWQACHNVGLIYHENGEFYYAPNHQPLFRVQLDDALIPFDIDNLGAYRTKRLWFIPIEGDNVDALSDIAEILSEELGGELHGAIKSDLEKSVTTTA